MMAEIVVDCFQWAKCLSTVAFNVVHLVLQYVPEDPRRHVGAGGG